ncbi:hypothetical protein [Lacunimicrobium album]
MSTLRNHASKLFLASLCLTGLTFSSGCERKVLDIEGPGGSGIEVKENPITNEKKVEVKGDDDTPPPVVVPEPAPAPVD